jgi:hypothetical protein
LPHRSAESSMVCRFPASSRIGISPSATTAGVIWRVWSKHKEVPISGHACQAHILWNQTPSRPRPGVDESAENCFDEENLGRATEQEMFRATSYHAGLRDSLGRSRHSSLSRIGFHPCSRRSCVRDRAAALVRRLIGLRFRCGTAAGE